MAVTKACFHHFRRNLPSSSFKTTAFSGGKGDGRALGGRLTTGPRPTTATINHTFPIVEGKMTYESVEPLVLSDNATNVLLSSQHTKKQDEQRQRRGKDDKLPSWFINACFADGQTSKVVAASIDMGIITARC